jgi:hypothetical protein
MVAICSSETSDNFRWTKGHYIPEDKTLQSQNVNLYAYFLDTPLSLEKTPVGPMVQCSSKILGTRRTHNIPYECITKNVNPILSTGSSVWSKGAREI